MAGRKIAANTQRLAALMERDRLDAVVVRSGVNVTYLSGVAVPGTLARHMDLIDSTRGFLVLWPRSGAPAIVTDTLGEGRIARDSWISDRVIYDGYAEGPYAALCRLLRDRGLDAARVGFERRYTNAEDWEYVARTLPHLWMADCRRMLEETRFIKTPAEVALIRRAADLLDTAYLEEFPKTRVGETEREVHARIVGRCIALGAGWTHGILNTGRNGVIYCGESEQKIMKGDVIRNDYVAYVQGYPGHQNRTVIMGRPSNEQVRDYATYLDVYRRSIDKCRAGMRTGDLYAFCVQDFKAKGWDYAPAHIGHGLGPWWHQQEPWIKRDGTTVIEEGMVLAIEPFIAHWHLQDLFLVAKDGLEHLSPKLSTAMPLVVE